MRVNRLTDVYNVISVLHDIPLGGEDLTLYHGAPRLVRAAGTEPFDTAADGVAVIEYPEPGEVVWSDDALDAAAEDRVTHLTQLGPDVRAVRRLITADATTVEGD